jgi:hypothetical protein
MDLHARVRGTPPSWHCHLNVAVAVAAAAVVASAAASPLLGNNCPNNDQESQGGNVAGDILGIAACGCTAVLMDRVGKEHGEEQR